MTDGTAGIAGPIAQPAQPPHELEPPAHRLHARADALEGQRLPGREHRHFSRPEPYTYLMRQPFGDGAARDGHHDRLP